MIPYRPHLHMRPITAAAYSILSALLWLTLPPPQAVATDLKRIAPRISAESTADLSTMRKRGVIRVLVTYKKTEYFVVNGQQRGFEYELMEQYERVINKGNKKGQLRLDLVYIPVPFEKLIPSLVEGRGDIVAAGLTITSERQKQVAFTTPYIRNVSEVVVTQKSDKSIRSTDDLSGRIVYVLSGSSYVQHLAELSEKFKDEGRPPIYVVESDPYLATEDILELVNAGIVKVTVADAHIARLWANVLPDITVHENVAVNTSGKIAWAVRKNNPELLAELNEFIRSNRKGTELGNVLFKRYYENTRWIQNPLSKSSRDKLDRYRALFQKYAGEYEFDWLLIAALAFQESRLNPETKSPRGAVGIMQIKPSTANDKNVRVKDVYKLENNVRAGVKYLAFLRDRYFSSPELGYDNSVHFSLAAYNAGPAKVRKMRARAEKMGLDPNVWFRNVERAAQQMVGSETTRYVANIYKYYLAYTLLTKLNDNKAAALDAQLQ
ncbi:MAG: lytic transglycosylase F [Gammaproteobacteria bacterium]|nr:MAG: lytic transglycosylase F [Gammaproteobacteria bacterium]